MARSDETFQENPAGVSSVLFYHATIIIHGKTEEQGVLLDSCLHY